MMKNINERVAEAARREITMREDLKDQWPKCEAKLLIEKSIAEKGNLFPPVSPCSQADTLAEVLDIVRSRDRTIRRIISSSPASDGNLFPRMGPVESEHSSPAFYPESDGGQFPKSRSGAL